jgi:hypothetical protein
MRRKTTILTPRKDSTRTPAERRKRGKEHRDTPAKLTPAQYVHVINYLYPV